MPLDADYERFLKAARSIFLRQGSTDADMIIKVMEEAGEVAEAWSGYRGTNPRKGADTHTLLDVAHELADVAASALVALTFLGFDAEEMLTWQVDKVKRWHPEDSWGIHVRTAAEAQS